MKKSRWKLYVGLLLLFTAFFAKTTMLDAAGTVTIFVDRTSLNVDDALQVSVKTSEPSDDAVPPQVTLTYDAQLLEFTYCSASYGGGEGGLITLGTTDANLSFRAKKAGSVRLHAEAILDEDANQKAEADKTISVEDGSRDAEQTAQSREADDTDVQAEVSGAQTSDEPETGSEGDRSQAVSQVSQPQALSSNAWLKKFKVTEAKLRPKFDKEVTDYTVTLKEDAPQLLYTAKTDDKNARIIAQSGFSNLKNGLNRAVLTVMAEDGTKLTYTFTIIKEGAAASTEDTSGREVAEVVDGLIAVKDSDLYVHTSFPDELLPEGCIKVAYVYKEQYVEAAYFEGGSMMILYLSRQDGSDADFYLYYSGTDEFMGFVQIKGAEGQFIFPIQFPVGVVIPDGFQDAAMQWGDLTIPTFIVSLNEQQDGEELPQDGEEDEDVQESVEEDEILPGNVSASPEDYYLLYAMNQDGGEGFYLYDSMEGTYQRFLQLLTSESDTSLFDEENYVIYKQKSQSRMVVIGVLIVIVVILLFLLLNVWLQLREFKAEDDMEDEEDDEEKEDHASGALKKVGENVQPGRKEPALGKLVTPEGGMADAAAEKKAEAASTEKKTADAAAEKKAEAASTEKKAADAATEKKTADAATQEKAADAAAKESAADEETDGKPVHSQVLSDESIEDGELSGEEEDWNRPSLWDRLMVSFMEYKKQRAEKKKQREIEQKRLEEEQGKEKQRKQTEERRKEEEKQRERREEQRKEEEQRERKEEQRKEKEERRKQDEKQLREAQKTEKTPENGAKQQKGLLEQKKKGAGERKNQSGKKRQDRKIQMEVRQRLNEAQERQTEQRRRQNGPIMFDLKIDDSLTPKMQREKLDDDFEFEFINIDED